jgi:maleylpyruvate isomerase
MARPTAEITAAIDGHRRLLQTVAGFSDDDIHAPSLLPGWTRSHVVSHLARNAESHVSLFESARLDEVRHQYASADARVAEIEAGIERPKDELYGDLQRWCDALEAAWTLTDDEHWDRKAIVTPGPRSMAEIVFRRLREIEVHHVDLGAGYTTSDWSETYIEGELRRRMPGLPDRASHLTLVEWLIGRAPAPDLAPW